MREISEVEKTINERFDDVMETNAEKKPDLETFPTFFDDPEYGKYCFKKMRKAWIQQFGEDGKGDGIERCLREEPTKENIGYLKKVRSRGIMLRNAYKFFDRSHECPKPLKEFVHNIGTFTDNAEPARTKERKEIAKALLDKGKWPAFAEKGTLEFRPDSIENFRTYVRGIFNIIKNNVRQKKLGMEDFHDTRKLLRQCSNLMQLPAVDNLGEGPHWLCRKLHSLSAYFGEAHAKVIAQHLPEKQYLKYEFEIDDTVREGFDEVLPYLEKAVG